MRYIERDISADFAKKRNEILIDKNSACQPSLAFHALALLVKTIFSKRHTGLPLGFLFITPFADRREAGMNVLYPSFDARASTTNKKLMQFQFSHPPLSEGEERLIGVHWTMVGEPQNQSPIDVTTILTYEKNGLIRIKGASRPGVVQAHQETTQSMTPDQISRDFYDKMIMLMSEKDRAIVMSLLRPLPESKTSTPLPP